MYSIYKTRTTAIIVSAIHFVNWSIFTRATCSRFKSIEKHWTRIEPLFIRIAALSNEREYRRGAWKVPKEISLWWRVIGRKPQISQQERCYYIRFTFTSQIVYAFLTRYGILALRMLTTPSLYSLFFFILCENKIKQDTCDMFKLFNMFKNFQYV